MQFCELVGMNMNNYKDNGFFCHPLEFKNNDILNLVLNGINKE